VQAQALTGSGQCTDAAVLLLMTQRCVQTCTASTRVFIHIITSSSYSTMLTVTAFHVSSTALLMRRSEQHAPSMGVVRWLVGAEV
jgi:hypothetical protein